MTTLTERLKQSNRIILEMDTGLILWGILTNIGGLFFDHNLYKYTAGIWFGVLFAFVTVIHMYRSLDRALDYDEKNARAITSRGYMIRYTAFIIIMVIIVLSVVLYWYSVFLAYMGVKVAAYIQPFTHKFYNQIFHESDPVAQPLDEENTGGDSRDKGENN